MARIASGVEGPPGLPTAREAAVLALSKLGLDIDALADRDLVVDAGRRAGGGSFWIVWLREDLLAEGGPTSNEHQRLVQRNSLSSDRST